MVDKSIALKKHKEHKGKVQIVGRVIIKNKNDLSIYYTPGVAYVSEAIKYNHELAYEYTNKGNTIAIVSDGTRILGLGNVGPEAGLPVMEGKSLLFKSYAGIDAIPICLGTTNEDEIINTIKHISPSIAGVNIEDIESPKSFRIIKKLSKAVDIPIFHDDQYGTAVVTLAALINALKIVKKDNSVKIVIFGAGSAGYGITKLLYFSGFKNLYVFDSKGIIKKNRKEDMNEFKEELANISNNENKKYTIEECISNADVLIGVSGKKGYFKKEWIVNMAEKPIVFALTNPEPEIEYKQAIDAGAFIAATGRSNAPNQVNNLIAFPGIMRGLLNARAKGVSMDMLKTAAITIASYTKKPKRDDIIASPLDEKVMREITEKMAIDVGMKALDERGIKKYNKNIFKKVIKERIKEYSKFQNVIK
ncbi:MAG: NAD(P)-dependent malic enzyme [Candidatus Micrarchaeia archaeon]